VKNKILHFFILLIFLTTTCVTVAFGAYGDSTGSKTFEDFDGKTIAVSTGSTFDTAAYESIKSPEIMYFNTIADQLEAITTGKADAMIIDEIMYYFMKKNGELENCEMIMGSPGFMKYAFFFSKDEGGAAIKAEIDDFIQEIRTDGRLDKILKHWINGEEYDLDIPYPDELTGENGTYTVATSSAYPPFNYMEDGEIVGYEADIIRLFAKEKGYKLEYYDMTYDATLVGVASGKYDIGASSSVITEERLKSMNYSDVVYAASYCLVYADDSALATANMSDANGLKKGFYRTFIEDSRWKLFADGVGSTVLITVLSLIFGTVIGFLVYLACRRGNKIANIITKSAIWLIQGLPMVVLIMILFYIVFGNTDFAGIWVAVVGFTITFAASVFQMIEGGVKTVDTGQSEAAYTVGYSELQTFFKIILPQAAQHFIVSFRTEAVFHLKATAIVGYIAVRDITKVSDVVRSITYEPFFPLIATAVIYIILGALLSASIKGIQVKIDPLKRKREAYLKGVKR